MTAEEIQKLDMEALTKSVQSIKESARVLEEHVLRINGNGKTRMSDFKDKFVKTRDIVVTGTKNIAKRTDAYVTEHPWIAAGAFAGIGILAGMMIRRRPS